MASLPVATPWFRVEHVAPWISRIEEPHVDEFLRSNIWHVRGTVRDLVVDSGLGVASLRQHLPALFANDPALVVTHGHLDHAGSAWEFTDRRAHPSERLQDPRPWSLRGNELRRILGLDWDDMPDVLLTAIPSSNFRLEDYAVKPAPPTSDLADGDVLDIGGRAFRVLHLPGHSPGSCCLFEDATGILFSGDVLYDDVLLDDIHGSDIPSYMASMRRLRDLDVTVVYPGHGAPFSGSRMRELIATYESTRR